MLRETSLFVSPILVLLLVVLTPVGTGEGAHRDQLLDPLFPHVHFAGGVTPRQSSMPKVAEQSQSLSSGTRAAGPAFGAGAGAASASLSLSVTPIVPAQLSLPVTGDLVGRFVHLDAVPAQAFAEPPPLPPPTPAS